MAASKNGLEGIWPGLESGVPKPLMPYSPAIKAGGWVFVAGTIASDFKTGLAPEVKSANGTLESELAVQARYVLRNLANTIRACGVDPDKDMVRIWQWPVDNKVAPEDFADGNNSTNVDMSRYLPVLKEFFHGKLPASSTQSVRELLCLGTKLEVEMLCIEGGTNEYFGEEPDGAATTVRRGDWVFTSAQHGADVPKGKTGQWVESDVEAQTEHMLAKLEKAAKAAGSSLQRAVKAEVYIGHPNDFAAMDRAWKRWFPNNPPARVVVPFLGSGVPGARVQAALTLITDASKLKIETIATKDAPTQPGHEPQAVKVGQLLFFSTQMAFDSTGNLAPGMLRNPNFPWYGSPGQGQMRYIMKNVSAICQAAGTTVDRICRRLCLHSDFQWFAESIEEWARYFPEDKPASTTLRIGGPLIVPGANVLFDFIAYVP